MRLLLVHGVVSSNHLVVRIRIVCGHRCVVAGTVELNGILPNVTRMIAIRCLLGNAFAHPTYIFLTTIAVWSIRTSAHASEHVSRHDTLRSLGKQRFTVEIIAVSSIGQWARYEAARIGHGFDLISAWSAVTRVKS